MKAVSIKDIAQKANVSITTVSFIINGKAKEKSISDAVVEKVQKLIVEMGYKPNQTARSLRTGNSYTIGLIVEDISNSFFSGIAKLIEDKAYQKGYKIIYSSTENSIEKTKGLLTMFSNRNVDAYIISPMKGIEDDLQQLIASGKPVVFFDRNLPGFETSYVGADHFSGARQATSYLISKGKKNIGFVTIDISVPQVLERQEGYKSAILKAGLPYNEKLVLKVGFEQDGAKTVDQLQELFAQPNLDGVVFATNYLALKGLKVLKNIGKKLNDDFTVVGYDDHEAFELHTPSVSSIQQPLEEIAENIIQIVLAQLSGKKQDVAEIILPTTFIERN